MVAEDIYGFLPIQIILLRRYLFFGAREITNKNQPQEVFGCLGDYDVEICWFDDFLYARRLD